MEEITKFQLIKDNLNVAKQLICENKSLQSFFLMFPIIEVIGENTFRNNPDKINDGNPFRKETLKSKSGIFTLGYCEIFHDNFSELDFFNQGYSFYKISRCGLYHSLSFEKDEDKKSSLEKELEKSGKPLLNVILTDSESELHIKDNQFFLGSLYTHNKIDEYLKKVEPYLEDNKYIGLKEHAFDIENIASISASGTHIVHSSEIDLSKSR